MPRFIEARQLLDYLIVFRRKLWMLVLIFCLLVGLTALATFRQKPIYEATCKIRYKQGSAANLSLPGAPFLWPNLYFDSVTFETEKHMIRSTAVAEAAAVQLGLAPADQPGERARWAKRIQSAIDVNKEENTRIYLIRIRWPDPAMAQAIANAVAEAYIEQNYGEKKESARRSFFRLTSQLDDLKKQIGAGRTTLAEYVQKEGVPALRSSAPGVSPDQVADKESSLLANLHVQVVDLRIQRGEKLIKYKEKHPKVTEIDQKIQVLLDAIRQEEERINLARKQAVEYEMLWNKIRADEELYNILLKKLTEVDLSRESIESDVEIIERAERPGAPIAPQKKKNLVLGSILGLVLGLGAIFVTEYFDPTLQTPEEVELYLDLPVLAPIPRMLPSPSMSKEEANRRFYQISENSPQSHEAEMFKRLRTNIRFSDFEATTMALLVTSSSPREGKTTITTNLGITMAHAGTTTVLIDTDLRRPAIQDIFNLKAGVGVSSFLKGEAELESIIFPSPIKGLSLIPAGPVPPNPAELLESPRLRDLIPVLKQRFGRIIFDSPPAGSLADASIIASLVDGVILVCFAGHTEKKFVLQTKHQLEKAGAKIYGVVLNYIELKLRSHYYYYRTVYRYGYR